MFAHDRCALFSTIHPATLPYVGEWADSVRVQSDRDFDLVLALDGVTTDELAAAAGELDARFILPPSGSTPAQVRNIAFGELVGEYDAIVLADADDVLSRERVANALRNLETSDVTACALTLIDEQSAAIGRDFCVLDAEERSHLDRLLPHANVFGLSNSSYRGEVLRACLPIPAECVIVDWFLATKAWASSASLKLDPRPLMSYRQHSDNIAKVLPPFSALAVRAATGLVLGHYDIVLAHGGLEGEHRETVERARERASVFSAKVLDDDAMLDSYLVSLNMLPPPRVWWTIVAHPDLEESWIR